jgi:hypothetical protein
VHQARATAETNIIDRRIAEHKEINRGYELQLQLKRKSGHARRMGAKRICPPPQPERFYDLSAKILEEVRRETPDCDAATVYPIVAAYFRKNKASRGAPAQGRVEFVDNEDGLPVVRAGPEYFETTTTGLPQTANPVVPTAGEHLIRHVRSRLSSDVQNDGLTDTSSSTSSRCRRVAPIFLPPPTEAAVDERVEWDQLMHDNQRLLDRFPGQWCACLQPDDLPPAAKATQREWRATPPTKPLRVSDIMRLQGVPARNHRKWPLWLVLTAGQLDGWQPKADGKPPGYTKAAHARVLRRAALAMRAMDDERLASILG